MVRIEMVKPAEVEAHLASGWTRTGRQVVRDGKLAAVEMQRAPLAPLKLNPSLSLVEDPGRAWGF